MTPQRRLCNPHRAPEATSAACGGAGKDCAPFKCTLFSPPTPFISCYGVTCCLVFIPLVSIKQKSGVEDCKSLTFNALQGPIPYLRTSPAEAPIPMPPRRLGRDGAKQEGREGAFQPGAANPSAPKFSFSGLFAQLVARAAPALPGLVESGFLQSLRVHLKEVVCSREEGSPAELRAQLALCS